MEILKIENLSFTYPLCDSPSVRDVCLTVNEGELVVLAGATGSGKSTLLRLLKPSLAPLGEQTGKIYLRGREQSDLSEREAAFFVGYVMQRPEQQLVTDKVWHELAFGLESMGLSQETISRRIAEMSCYFGIEELYEKNVDELSGGQKQLVNLAAVMVTNPNVLILDEPTSQLDPIAASDFLATLKKLNEELSLTIIIIEHRLEELIPICDRLVILDDGKVLENGAPRDVLPRLSNNKRLFSSLPSAARLYHALDATGDCPLTVREGRRFIENGYSNKIRSLRGEPYMHRPSPALELSDVYFRYEKALPDVLCGTSLTVYENEIFCILGGNGSGKSTALNTAAALLSPYSGGVRVFGKKLKEYKNGSLYKECVALLPQDVQTVFLKNTVREELDDAGANSDTLPFDISPLYDKHPYDLSGGEQQLVALAKVLAQKPRLLLLDEPSKGLDADKKQEFCEILSRLKADGVTVVTVTHDAELAAACADRLALFFRGKIVSCGTPSEFFSDNSFYTTAASRMSRGYFDGAVTVETLAELCRQNGVK